ncbi:MAG: ankyrin repeat domain-containing protein [Pseudomonadota bacterium]
MNTAALRVLLTLTLLSHGLPTLAAGENDANLVEAVGRGDKHIIKLMTDMGANPRGTDQSGNTAVLAAAAQGNLALARKYADLGSDIDRKGGNGFTPLGIAALNGDVRMVEFLIKSGAELDTRNDNGGTALTNALEAGHYRVADLLLKAGADVDIANRDGMTPLMLVLQEDKPDVALLDGVLARKPDLRATDLEGRSVLFIAILQHNQSVAERLLAMGANPNQLAMGYLPLHWASVFGEPVIAKLLEVAGAKPARLARGV